MNNRRDFLKGMMASFVAVPAMILGRQVGAPGEVMIAQSESLTTVSYEEDWQIQSVDIIPSTALSKSLRPDRQIADLIVTDLDGIIVAAGKPPYRLGGLFQFHHMGSDWVMNIHTGSEHRNENPRTITLTGSVRRTA